MPQSLSLDVPADLIKDPRSWTVEDISVWLHWLGIGEHARAFSERGVNGLRLLQLSNESSWSEFGVVDPAQHRVLDSAIEPLRCFRDADGAESGLALHAIEGPVAGEVFLVGAGGITGGRHSASNGIVLPENYVSRRHFQITKDPAGQHLLQDIGSTTGTFLMVREDLPLDHLMILQLGTTELTVHMTEGDQCTLVATEGPDKGAQAVVPPQGLFIGREASNNLCIRDPQISAFHGEVRFLQDQGFILDDKYSTNRTWLRLAPDGQPSEHFPLRVQDLFKVGSTLFHVVEPTSIPAEPVTGAAQSGIAGAAEPSRIGAVDILVASVPDSADEEWIRVVAPDIVVNGGAGALDARPRSGHLSSTETGSQGGIDAEGGNPVSQLRWEPFLEGEPRATLAPEAYARRITASRRRMHVDGPSQRTSAHGGGQDGIDDLRERELSSLQQCMRNSRAQTAYTLQQQRDETRRDEDMCKICYDRDIDVVLYPCGHFIICRWCAAKVSDCPVCRFVITDVIRTYKG